MKFFKTDEHPNIAITLSNMASIYSDLGQLQKALEINERVKSIQTEYFFLQNLILLFTV